MTRNDEKYIKVCPKCGSTNITVYTKAGTFSGEILSEYCKDCNYGYTSGGFFPELKESKIGEFRKQLKENKNGKK